MRVKDIKGFEGFYAITDEGHLLSLYREWRDSTGRLRCMGSRVLAKNPDKRGYIGVTLSAYDRETRYTAIHVLVAEAFCYPYGGEVVNHLDGNRENNRSGNLEWCTHHANVVHGALRKQHVYLTGSQIMEVQRLFNTMPTSLLAEKFGVHKTTIDRICKPPRPKKLKPA